MNTSHIYYLHRLKWLQLQKKKIADKQRKIADKFSSAAQKIAIKSTKAEKVANDECRQDQNEKYKIDDVSDNMPDSSVIW